jgi:hypothetical protein
MGVSAVFSLARRAATEVFPALRFFWAAMVFFLSQIAVYRACAYLRIDAADPTRPNLVSLQPGLLEVVP